MGIWKGKKIRELISFKCVFVSTITPMSIVQNIHRIVKNKLRAPQFHNPDNLIVRDKAGSAPLFLAFKK